MRQCRPYGSVRGAARKGVPTATKGTCNPRCPQVPCAAMRPLPEFLRPWFWDVEFEDVRLPERKTFVLERLLELGDDRTIRWVKDSFPLQDIADVVRRSRRISPKTARFWSLVLDIPAEEIRCLSTRFPARSGIS